MQNTMNNITQFEDLSNELLIEIFEYLHALNLFLPFTSLNHRISSILSFTPLRIVVTKLHCHHQMKFLSSHLTHHAHQVISISLEDQLRDLPSVISFFFNRHTFKNLQSCKFYSVGSSSDLNNVLKKLQTYTKLVFFEIRQPKTTPLSGKIKQNLSSTILRCNNFKLLSINMFFWFNHSNLNTNITINSTLTALQIMFHCSTVPCSIYSILPILRQYQALRMLHIALRNDDNANTQSEMLPILASTYKNNPPVLLSLKTFDLYIRTSCDFRPLNFILRCMPNLRRFITTIVNSASHTPSFRSLLNGEEWQRLITETSLQLDAFDLILCIFHSNLVFDPNAIINSFDYFARKYHDWYLGIHRSQTDLTHQKQCISLRGFRRSKPIRSRRLHGRTMVLDESDIHSTAMTDAHLCYSNLADLHIVIPKKINVHDIPSGEQLFKNLDHLIIEMNSLTVSFWKYMLNIFRIRRNTDEIDKKQRADQLVSLVDLTTITKLELKSSNDTSDIHFIKAILLASSRLIQLEISTLLIFSPLVYDDSSLHPIFARLQSLRLLPKDTGLPLKYASQLVERFPSLIHLELKIDLIDLYGLLLDTLLDGLSKLIHLKIHFYKNTLISAEPRFIDYIIQRRHQAFPSIQCNRENVSVQIKGQIMDIYLNGCSICTHRKYFV